MALAVGALPPPSQPVGGARAPCAPPPPPPGSYAYGICLQTKRDLSCTQAISTKHFSLFCNPFTFGAAPFSSEAPPPAVYRLGYGSPLPSLLPGNSLTSSWLPYSPVTGQTPGHLSRVVLPLVACRLHFSPSTSISTLARGYKTTSL